MCGQCYAYNRYATLPDSNSLSMGFSGYQNVNFSSQRDNKKRIYKIKEYKGNPANVLFAGFFSSSLSSMGVIQFHIHSVANFRTKII